MKEQAEFLAEVGRRLAAARGQLPKREMMRRAGVAEMTISQVEAGRSNPSLIMAVRLAQAYGVSLDALVEGLRPAR